LSVSVRAAFLGSVALLLGSVSIAACGGSEASDRGASPPGPPTSSTDLTTTRNGTPPTPPPGDGGGDGALGKQDANKGDVPDLLSFATPNKLCPGESPAPTIHVLGTSDMSGKPVALAGFVLCFTGFTPDGNLDVILRFPDGSEHPLELALDDRGAAAGDQLGAEPTGAYAVTATDRGDASKTASATVWKGRVAASPESAALGVPFEITLEGFPPDLEVAAFLYKREPCELDPAGCWTFRAYLPAIATDGSGQGRLGIATTRDDPDGSYCVMLGNFSSLDPCRVMFTATPS
jgi:hypothetical protein